MIDYILHINYRWELPHLGLKNYKCFGIHIYAEIFCSELRKINVYYRVRKIMLMNKPFGWLIEYII